MSARRRVLDRTVRQLFKLPKTKFDVAIASKIRVPMRDGTRQLVDHLAPVGPAKGTILVRSPYGWNALTTAVLGTTFAGNGYHVVLARTRGTFGSEGVFEPAVHEVQDGADTVDWLRQQSWFDGRFATLGASYFGFTQWAILADPPDELVTSVILAGPHNFRDVFYSDGAFNLELALTWSELMASQEDHSLLRSTIRGASVHKRVAPALRTLPLPDAADEITQHRWPWFREWASRRDPDDSFWTNYQLQGILDRVDVPVFLAGGWQDIFLANTLEQYTHLRSRGIEAALTMGAWTHGEMGTKGASTLFAEALDWFDHHLAHEPLRRATPVRIHVGGAADEWREVDLWPPPTGARKLIFDRSGSLEWESARRLEPEDQPCASFVYDPSDPTPTLGGRLLTGSLAGYRNDTSLAARSDVLVYDSSPLSAAQDVIGQPVLTLAHSADTSPYDLFVRLSDVSPEGKSTNVADGFIRGRDSDGAQLRIALDATSYRFAAGHRIRLLVAGGSFPHYERNLGAAADPATSTATASTCHEIDLSASYLTLPSSPVS